MTELNNPYVVLCFPSKTVYGVFNSKEEALRFASDCCLINFETQRLIIPDNIRLVRERMSYDLPS